MLVVLTAQLWVFMFVMTSLSRGDIARGARGATFVVVLGALVFGVPIGIAELIIRRWETRRPDRAR